MNYEIRINGGQGTFRSLFFDNISEHMAIIRAEQILDGIRICGGKQGYVGVLDMERNWVFYEAVA